MNGRECLAKQMDDAGIAYVRQDNTFGWVADFAAAQRLFRGLRVMSGDDRQVLTVLSRGANTIVGIRNRDSRAAPYGKAPRDPQNREQPSARVSRWFALVQAERALHGLPAPGQQSRRDQEND